MKMFNVSRAAPAFAMVVALAAGLLASPAHAQQKIVAAQSDVAFVSKQLGVPIEGHFKKFDAQLQINTAKPQDSSVRLTIDMASATLGVPETDAELPKANWFNTAKFAQATFESTAVKNLGAGKWEVAGKLNIKGQSRDVVVPVALSQSGSGAQMLTQAQGQLTIKRLAFKIGENEWADTSMVADDVLVKFKLTLTGVAKL